jgi:hypothetical protein
LRLGEKEKEKKWGVNCILKQTLRGLPFADRLLGLHKIDFFFFKSLKQRVLSFKNKEQKNGGSILFFKI